MSYELTLTEKGQSNAVAKDSLELVSFSSRLPVSQDGLTYKGIGDKTETYFLAGLRLMRRPGHPSLPSSLAERLSHTGEAPELQLAPAPVHAGGPTRRYHLAQTGPLSAFSLFLLMLASFLGYRTYQRKRTTTLKRLALQPI